METMFKNLIVETLKPYAAKFAQDRGLYLLRVEVRGTEFSPVIEVILDGDRSVTIDDCEAVSKDLHVAIEAGRLVRGNFRLDVLSPGTDEPLVHDWQFERNLGRLVEVHYQDAEETHTLHGHLREYSQKEIAIEPIHVKVPKPPVARAIATKEGPVILQADEQLYENLTRVVVQTEIGKSGFRAS